MKNNKKSSGAEAPRPGVSNLETRRKYVESTATLGLILVMVGLAGPFADMMNLGLLRIFEWVYAAGALVFLVARTVNVSDPDESLRIRRLRRLEFWAGVAFAIAAFFWFYNMHKFHIGEPGIIYMVGPLKILQETVMFSLVGATIQVIASWMIYYRQKKEQKR